MWQFFDIDSIHALGKANKLSEHPPNQPFFARLLSNTKKKGPSFVSGQIHLLCWPFGSLIYYDWSRSLTKEATCVLRHPFFLLLIDVCVWVCVCCRGNNKIITHFPRALTVPSSLRGTFNIPLVPYGWGSLKERKKKTRQKYMCLSSAESEFLGPFAAQPEKLNGGRWKFGVLFFLLQSLSSAQDSANPR